MLNDEDKGKFEKVSGQISYNKQNEQLLTVPNACPISKYAMVRLEGTVDSSQLGNMKTRSGNKHLSAISRKILIYHQNNFARYIS